jgi:hypothetical protein
MAKRLTKAQKHRMIVAILTKTNDLWRNEVVSLADMISIDKITTRAFKRLK